MNLVGHHLFFIIPMWVLKGGRLSRRLGSIVNGRLQDFEVLDSIFADHVTGQGGVP